ncbi:MAG: SUMF1/EgtB/PvdO family nonheme iron enzyme [Verrucomicrobia bacterium]|nr:SUMF1/EgtB/PvdO family nonheme iron enzyme [Verrucomicrobiota bacterium]
MNMIAKFAGLLLVVVVLLAAGCGGEPEVKLPPATPDNSTEARNQMIAALGKIRTSDAPYLRELVKRGRDLEKAGDEAMAAKNYTKALSSFTQACKCYQQAVDKQTEMEAKRDAAIAMKKQTEAALEAANSAFRTDARPESFVTAGKNAKEADVAMTSEDFAKALELFTRAVGGYKAAQAEADKLLRAEKTRVALAAKKDAETERMAANAVFKTDARPESFASAGTTEKEAEEALAKEDFDRAKELFVRAAERYRIAQADGNKLLRDELSRAAYAKKKEAEDERLTAQAAFKNDTRPESFVTAGNCFKEGEEALAKEEFARAKDLFTRAAASFKAAQTDIEKIYRLDAARAAWAKLLAEADAPMLERQAAAEFAKVKSQAESAAKDPGQAADQVTAATTALKDLIAKAKTKENLPKAAPVVMRLESALRTGQWLQAHGALGELEQLVPDDPRMADFRKKAEAVAWPNALTLDVGGTTIDFVLIRPGSFTMGEGKEAHQVTLTKPYFMSKCEVMQKQWLKVMGSNPSSRRYNRHVTDYDLLPLDNVSWVACQGFLAKLNEKLTGLKVVLPTEAQWEYACRAGSTGKYCFGNDVELLKDYAWFPLERSWRSHDTQQVGTKKPNAWGLHDMHGNVSEYCSDWYGPLPATAQEDPQGPASSSGRVLRGGSSRDYAHSLTTTFRREVMPVNVLENAGLRLVLVTDAIAAYHASLKPTEVPAAAVVTTAALPAALSETIPAAIAAAMTSTSSVAAATTAVASLTTPSMPPATTGPVSPDDWMKGIPPNALPAFVKAQADAKAGKGLLAMRSWRAFWGNRLRDPTRGHVELEFAELLLTDTSKEANAAAEAQKKEQNIREAGMIVRTIRTRNVTDMGLLNRLEETAKKLP